MEKLKYSMKLHDELHRNYELISKMTYLCLDKGLQMVIENPYTNPHYLRTYWPIKPAIVDTNRRDNGDYMRKPTQFFFINRKPYSNLIFEPIENVELRVCEKMKSQDGKNRTVLRSEIHPQYASRFIRQFLLPEKE